MYVVVWFSLEVSQCGVPNEYLQHTFLWRNKNKYHLVILFTFIWNYCIKEEWDDGIRE